MKIHKYCRKTLTYKPISLKLYSAAMICMMLMFCAGFTTNGFYKGEDKQMPEEEMVVIINKNINDSFQPYMLYDYLKELNVKFPEIVFAQACLETGNFKSQIFRDNHNCFGMKLSSRRPTTTHEVDHDHATYNNWRESALDYAFYQAAFLNDLKTKQDYMAYIEANYSGTPGYTNLLQDIINNLDNHLKRPTTK